MWGRLGPRFALEALFLVLVAVGLGFADVRPLVIVLVMAGAWLLVSLIELVASRAPRYAPLVAPGVAPPAPAAPVVGADTEPGLPPGVEPAGVGVEEQVAPAEAAEPVVAETEGELVEPVGEAIAPWRRWFRRRPQPGGEAAVEPAAQPELEPPEAGGAPEIESDPTPEPKAELEREEAASEVEREPAPEPEPDPEPEPAAPQPETPADPGEPAADSVQPAPSASAAGDA